MVLEAQPSALCNREAIRVHQHIKTRDLARCVLKQRRYDRRDAA